MDAHTNKNQWSCRLQWRSTIRTKCRITSMSTSRWWERSRLIRYSKFKGITWQPRVISYLQKSAMKTLKIGSHKPFMIRTGKRISRKTLNESYKWANLVIVLTIIRLRNCMEPTTSTIWCKLSNRATYLESQSTHSQRLGSATGRTYLQNLRTKCYTTLGGKHKVC